MAKAAAVGEDVEEAEEVKPRPRLARKRLLAIGGAFAALLLCGGAAALFLWPSEHAAQQHAVKPAPLFYPLPEITVNLNAGENRTRYLKMKVALEVEDRDAVAIIEPNLPRLLDIFQVYLRELRTSDLEGSAGLYRLREELVRRVNLTIAPKHVEDVLFQEILVQ
jgi:flagellar FliL protein